MNPLTSIRDYWRIAAGVRDYAGRPIPANASQLIRGQIENREATWLSLVQRAVFDVPSNPYFRMFELADCKYGDLRHSVQRNGLTSTLETLHDEGVHLTFDEFKGKEPIVRAGKEIRSSRNSFQNRLQGSWLDSATSGSSGKRSRVAFGTGALLLREMILALVIEDFDLNNYKRLIVRPIMPSTIGVMQGLSMSRLGCPMDHWYATGGSHRHSLHYRMLTRYLLHASRRSGATLPSPEYLRAGDFETATKWIARAKEAGSPSMISAFVSPAVRMAIVAKEQGWDISDSLFICGGEALTAAKSKALSDVGVGISPRYWVSEIGPIGIGCHRTVNQNRMHLLDNVVALISRRRPAPFSHAMVDAALFTSVSPDCATVLINAEMGDSASIRKTDCDCAFGRAGLQWEISDVTSYSKLTGQGMTLMGNDVVALLEEHLPAKFGGAPADYQLVEWQGGSQTELELRVSPRVGMRDSGAVKREFVQRLRSVYGGSLATRVWEHSDGLRVVEKEPFSTATGKVPPLHLASNLVQNKNTHES
jgi:hypothetical protein